jgi:hypothetical protein
MARNRFTNPADGSFYDWQINHADEDAVSKSRNITRSGTTDNVGVVRQQGDAGPLTLKYSGTILHRAQLVEFWRWFEISRDQTIYFTDFDGQEFEVQITEFSPQRHRTLRNPRDPSAPLHYWTYSITLDVFAIRTGDMLDAGVTP